MITEKDLLEAIAECQGQRNPNANTCIKLAAYYTILDNIRQDESKVEGGQYSYAIAPKIENLIDYASDTEFAQLVHGKDINEVMGIIDELMSTLQVIQPRLYAGVLRKFE